MNIMQPNLKHYTILFVIGVAGILFYALGPIFFPHNHDLRQPELLPVYTLMIGLGQILKSNSIPPPNKEEEEK